MAVVGTHFEILTHFRHHCVIQSEEWYILELAVLILAPFPRLSHIVQYVTESWDEPNTGVAEQVQQPRRPLDQCFAAWCQKAIRCNLRDPKVRNFYTLHVDNRLLCNLYNICLTKVLLPPLPGMI